MLPCSHCKIPGKRHKICAGCLEARYCSTDCQRAAWPSHKGSCKKSEIVGPGKTEHVELIRLVEGGNVSAVQAVVSMWSREQFLCSVRKTSTILHVATLAKQYEVCKALLQLGAPVDAGSGRETPLMAAVYKNDVALCDLFVEVGANVHAVDDRGFSILCHACQLGNPIICKRLLDAGASYTTAPSPLLVAASSKQTAACLVLLDAGADVNKIVSDMSCLYAAADCADVSTCALLLKRGAAVDVGTTSGTTPLHAAANVGSIEICQLLIAHGANIHAVQDSGATPLFSAASRGHAAVCRLLAEAGANLNAQRTDVMYRGTTPLHFAACNGHLEAIRVLIECGALLSVAARGLVGSTPLDLAKAGKHGACVELLKAAGALEHDDDVLV
eukprot:TRINITY_DN7428_c0_g1_i1.p1 TRINITY_DN7428_c0_g1~~TRINITY_DN7428_c0_g1_i1.p1  ORF type:complete len:387 (-),score=65.58 TRINITY_DN7428_c0_g1_i1:29-1189(-)